MNFYVPSEKEITSFNWQIVLRTGRVVNAELHDTQKPHQIVKTFHFLEDFVTLWVALLDYSKYCLSLNDDHLMKIFTVMQLMWNNFNVIK